MQITDGRYKYARSPAGDAYPLSLWSNRWSTMPIPSFPGLRLPDPDRRAIIDFMPDSDIPVLRQPFAPGDMLPFWCANQRPNTHCLYDLENDPDESENLLNTPQEKRMVDLLRTALDELDAPAEQLVRLGIS